MTPTSPGQRAVQQLSPMHIIIQMIVDSARHNAAAARVQSVVFAIAVAILAPLEWRYDMLPTLEWLDVHGLSIRATMAAAYGQAVGSSLLLITPLIIKSVTARWAHQLAFLGTAFAFAELIDIVTNWKAAWELLYSLAPTWAASWPGIREPLQFLLAWASFFLVLIVTTSVFQVLLIACVFCFLASLWNSFSSRMARIVALGAVVGIVLIFVSR